MDMISQLPESIVHEILGFISTPEELVRMSVLSKTWFDLTASYPVLAFEMSKLNISRESFFKYIEYTTSRFCHQNVPAHTFFVEATGFQEPAEVDIVNKCLELVLKKGVKALCICDFDILSDAPKYRLPNTLLNVSMLEELAIVHCELPSSLTADVFKFKSLTVLALVDVHIDDEVIKHLATSCPLLEELYIAFCPSVKRLFVHGHQNLKRVHFTSEFPVETIDIEAPNLTDITIIDANGRLAPLMNLASCKQLTTVTFIGNPLSNLNGFNDFLSNFPFIENLILSINCECNNLKFSSHSLRTFVLVSSHSMAGIEFSTPNLGLYIKSLTDWNPGDVMEHLPELQACMQSYRNGHGVWFNELRLFMDKETGLEITSLYIYADQKFTELEKLKAIERSPKKVNDVVLDLQTHEDHAAIVDALLWCCRPRSLTLRSISPSNDFGDVAKFTHEKLLQQEDQGHTKIHIVLPSGARIHFSDLKSSLKALPREQRGVLFIKEEDSPGSRSKLSKVCGCRDFLIWGGAFALLVIIRFKYLVPYFKVFAKPENELVIGVN